MKCGFCFKELEENFKFCPYCGQNLKQQYPLSSEAPQATTSSHYEEDIRKHATVLFADVKGSTALLENLDPEEAKNLLIPIVNRMCESIYNYDGSIIKIAGDGVIAVFGAPYAMEDHALRACLAALLMQEHIVKINAAVQIRVGLNSGEVYLEIVGNEAHRNYDVVGITVNVAARMEQTAKPGSIQITQNTLSLVEKEVEIIALGAQKIKGLSKPIDVYELKSVIKNRSLLVEKKQPSFLPFVGREKEIDFLNQLAEQAKLGQGTAINIIGEAGQGKSRLVYEFLHQEKISLNFELLMTATHSHTRNIPYLPLIQALQNWMHILPKEPVENIRKKIESYLNEIKVPYALEAILALLGIPVTEPGWEALEPLLKRKSQFKTILAILSMATQKKLLIFVIEDLYWIDSETEDFLDILIPHIKELPMLLVLTSRLEYVDRWVGQPNYRQIKLGPLPKNNQVTVLNNLLGTDSSLQGIKNQLLKDCAGNPFFLEEMIKSLVQDRILIGKLQHYHLSEKALASEIKLPESIFAVLQTQLDNLSPLERKILRVASVIGSRFTHRMLTKVMDDEDAQSIQQGLHTLAVSELIYETHIYPESQSAFKHALIQEVTYNTLLKTLRRAIHIKILSVLESLPAEEKDLQLQAYHAFQGEDWDKAFYYCHSAGQDAFFLSANKSAAAWYEKALIAAEHLAKTQDILETCLVTHIRLMLIYFRLCSPKDESKHIKLAEKLLELSQNEDKQALKVVLYVFSGGYELALGHSQKAVEWHIKALKASQSPKNDTLLAVSQISAMSPYFLLGEYKTLYDKVNQTLVVLPTLDYRHRLFPLPIGYFVNCMGWWAHAYTGDYDPKVHLETQVHSFISSTNIYQSNLDSFFVLMPVCFMYFYQGVFKQAVNYLSRTLTYAIELEIDLYIPSLSAALSCTYLRLNQKEEGKKYLDRALTAFYSNDSYIPKMLSLDLITEALLLLGDYPATQTFCQKSLQIAEDSQLAGIKATLLRLNAEIALNLPEPNYSLIQEQLTLSMKSGEKLGMLLNTAHCQYLFATVYQQMGDKQASKQAKKIASNSYMKLGFRRRDLMIDTSNTAPSI